jgi:hypothetical protein
MGLSIVSVGGTDVTVILTQYLKEELVDSLFSRHGGCLRLNCVQYAIFVLNRSVLEEWGDITDSQSFYFVKI